MVISNGWQTRTALALTVGMVSTITAPMLSTRAIAGDLNTVHDTQIMAQYLDLVVPAGTVIPVELEDAERIVVAPDETLPVTLIVTENVRSSRGTILIPFDSRIEGSMSPVGGGTQFVAETVVLSNSSQRLPIRADSNVITQTETINRRTNPNILRGAVIGAAAGALLGEIFGSIDVLEVLGGAGLGAVTEVLLRGNEEVDVFVIEPETDLQLTLQQDFVR